MRTVRLALCFAALVAGPMVAAPAWAQSAEGSPDQATAEFPRISDDEETIYAVQRKAYIVKDK